MVEYRAMPFSCREIVWLGRLFQELRISYLDPIIVFADNISAIRIVSNPVYHEHTKHLEVGCHFILDLFQEGIITLLHVASNMQLANFLTQYLQ